MNSNAMTVPAFVLIFVATVNTIALMDPTKESVRLESDNVVLVNSSVQLASASAKADDVIARLTAVMEATKMNAVS